MIWGFAVGVDDMRALAAVLIQADKFGSSIAQAFTRAVGQYAREAKPTGRRAGCDDCR